MPGDLREECMLPGDAGSESSGMTSERREDWEWYRPNDSRVSALTLFPENVEGAVGESECRAGDCTFDNGAGSDKAQDANSAVSSRTSCELS